MLDALKGVTVPQSKSPTTVEPRGKIDWHVKFRSNEEQGKKEDVEGQTHWNSAQFTSCSREKARCHATDERRYGERVSEQRGERKVFRVPSGHVHAYTLNERTLLVQRRMHLGFFFFFFLCSFVRRLTLSLTLFSFSRRFCHASGCQSVAPFHKTIVLDLFFFFLPLWPKFLRRRRKFIERRRVTRVGINPPSCFCFEF